MTKRRLNLGWLSGVMFGTLFFLGVCYGIRHFQIKRNCGIFLRLADEAEAKNEYEKLESNLRRYVRLNPRDPIGLVRLVVFQSEPGRWENSSQQTRLFIYQKLIQATEFVAERKDVWERLVRLGISIGRYQDTLVTLKGRLQKDAPNNPEYLEYEATCHYQLKNYKEADRCWRKAREEAPDRLQTYISLALLAEKLEQVENVEPIINEMVANNPDDSAAYLTRASWRWNQLVTLLRKRALGTDVTTEQIQEVQDSCEKDYEKAFSLKENDQLILIRYAEFCKRIGKTENARKLLLSGIQNDSKDVIFARELAILEYQTGNQQLGLKLLNDLVREKDALVKEIPKERVNSSTLLLLDMKLLLAEWAIERANDDVVNDARILELFQTLRSSKKFSSSRLSYIEAQFDARNMKWSSVISKLEPNRILLSKDPEKLQQADFLLGVAHARLQSPEQALRSFQDCLHTNPDRIGARKEMAKSLRSLNRLPEAIVELRKVINRPGADSADQILFAEFLLQWNLSNPTKQRTWTEFDKLLRAVGKEDPQFLSATVLKLRQLNAENQLDEYETLLRTARSEYPDDLQLFDMEYKLALSQKDWRATESLLKTENQARGESVQSRVHQGLEIINRQPQENAKLLLGPLSVPLPEWTSLQQGSLAAEFSDLYLQIGAFDEAFECLNRVKAAIPDNNGLILQQVKIVMQSGNLAKAEELLNDYRNLIGDNAIWHLENARLIYIRSNQGEAGKLPMSDALFQAAINHLKTANQQRVNWDELHHLWGDVYNRHRDIKESLDEYIAALNAGAKQSVIASKAINLQMNVLSRYDEADSLIRRLKTSGFAFNNQLLHEEINLSVIFGRNQEALELLKLLPEELPPTSGGLQYLAPAWRGDKYLSLREYQLAEVQFRLAILRDKADSLVIPSLVGALMGQGEQEKAAEALEEAKKCMDLQNNPSVMAACYENLGKEDLAEKWYRIAAENLPDDFSKKFDVVYFLRRKNRLDDTEAELRQILAAVKTESTAPNLEKNRVTELTRTRIRALLSLVDVLHTARQNLSESLVLINECLSLIETTGVRSNLERESPLRLKTRILEKLGNRNEIEESISILEGLEFKPPITELKLDDQQLLASLYYRLGDSSRGRHVLLETIATIKSETRFDASQAELLREVVLQSLKNKEDAEAKLYLSRLEKLAPEALNTKDTEIRVLESNNKLNEIKQILKAILVKYPDEKNILAWAAVRYEWVADRRIQNPSTEGVAKDFYDEAERLYVRYTEVVPEGFIVLSAFQLKTEHIESGIDLLNAHLNELQFQQLSMATRNLINNPKTDVKASAGRLYDILAAREQHLKVADQKALRSLMADLLTWSGDNQRADAIHQKLVEENEKDYIVLNNYAFFLALSNGNLSNAKQLINKAIDLAGPLPDLLDTRGYVELALGHSAAAVLDFEDAVKKRESAERYFHLAIAYSKLKKPKKAFEAYERSVELGLMDQVLNHPREQVQLKQLLTAFKDAGILLK